MLDTHFLKQCSPIPLYVCSFVQLSSDNSVSKPRAKSNLSTEDYVFIICILNIKIKNLITFMYNFLKQNLTIVAIFFIKTFLILYKQRRLDKWV